MCIKILLGILSKFLDLSGNIEKYFDLGLWILFYFDYEGLWWVLRFLELLFLKNLKLTKKVSW